ncbi:LacI family DNA-binding transcriptional regulator [Loigolactobacillus binensis]|uniref:LacI family DNA-binding transcriptional regulator n=1 Tax=Loigolactobacillus binensis TaxID=2559922 RepID=A0ABW3EGF8_9LACO|nr:LacI family DNA-binding transcriptional regulator [Loigolactobacillus binensis]
MTLKDIAKQTGYSASTVSRALNHDPRISAEATQIIQKVATATGYTKDFAALNLNNRESNILAVVFPPENLMNVNNPFYVEIIKQANYIASKHGYMVSVVMAKSMAALQREVSTMITSGKVRKYILLYNLPKDPVTQHLKKNGVRFVVIGDPHDATVTFVDNDNYAVGVAVAEQKFTQFQPLVPAYIYSNQRWQYEVDRLKGLKHVFAKRGVALTEFTFDQQNLAAASQAFRQLLRQHNLLIISSDDLLIQLYGLLHHQQPVQIISFNNSDFIQPISEHIQSVDLQPQKMGEVAAKILFKPENKKISQANYIDFRL